MSAYEQAIYETGLEPQSIFTDRGPIAKPPLTLASGSTATISGFSSVSVPAPQQSFVGKYLRLSSTTNGGTYRIVSVSGNSVGVEASFSLPDPQSGSILWEVFDPRNGQIADDPADVTVLVSNSLVTPLAVIGMLGQIVLPEVPAPEDEVLVSYYYINTPRVYGVRYNSKEFVMNAHGQDLQGQHSYRAWSLIPDPAEIGDSDIQARLDQPLLRDLKYRALERAYSVVANDPNLLVYNAPNHKVAYPYLEKYLTQEFVSYDPAVLPETVGWVRQGTGAAAIISGVLVVSDLSGANFGVGQEIFWTRPVDLSFEHVFAMSWHGRAAATVTDHKFSGVVAGYSGEEFTVVVGLLEDGTKKVGLLLDSTAPQELSSWASAELDWTADHSFRLYVDESSAKLYVDGSVTPTLEVLVAELPQVAELNAPFDTLMGVFFGSVSYPAINQSFWTFVRYLVVPTSPLQVEPSLFKNYEGDVTPDEAGWAIVGSHGYERVDGSELVASSTSANTSGTGVTDDFRGYFQIEPLARTATSSAVDFAVHARRHTHGVDGNAITVTVNDGNRCMQLSLLADRASPKISYGGRTMPGDLGWSAVGGQGAVMWGQRLKITDVAVGDGLVFFIEDTLAPADPDRVISPSKDFILESRLEVVSYAVDVGGFAGAFAQVFDGDRLIGWMLSEIAGVKYVTLHSDGAVIASTQFDWSGVHTIQLVKDLAGSNVVVIIDGVIITTSPLGAFTQVLGSPDGMISFGSATTVSAAATSEVLWHYVNAWTPVDARLFLGLWNGRTTGTLLDYHLPVSVIGKNAAVNGNVLTSPEPLTGAAVGDLVVIDFGSNQGVYEITGLPTTWSCTVPTPFPAQPSIVDFRVLSETDWTVPAEYRILRSTDLVSVYRNGVSIMSIDYDSSTLPGAAAGISWTIANGLPSVSFGAFSNSNLSEAVWDYVRYGITRAAVELVLAPHHAVLNQRNGVASPEHLSSQLPHSHTDFWSSSTGKPPALDPDFLENSALVGYTRLNESTPLVPRTQTLETYGWLTPEIEFVNGLNDPAALFDGEFTYNDTKYLVKALAPDRVLYNALEVKELTTGEPELLAPADDQLTDLGTIHWTKEVCDVYTADAMPESSGWIRASDDDSKVSATVFAGSLTYSTDAVGTKTIYRKESPLLDLPSLESEVKFKLRVLADASSGLGDSQIRMGVSAPGLTVMLALVSAANGFRYVLVKDPVSGSVLGGIQFNFLDGNYHTYSIRRAAGSVFVSAS